MARRWFWLACTAGIAFASLTRTQAIAFVSFLAEYGDKCMHFAMYLVYALASCWAGPHRGHRWQIFSAVTLTCSAYGFLMEILQSSFPSLQRQFSIADALANSLGAATGAWLWIRSVPPPTLPVTGAVKAT